MSNIRVSNCGKSENGGIYGNPGDQTHQEYWNISIWNNGWQYVFRYPSSSVASLIALYAEHAANNDAIGYSQSGRETMWQQISFLNGTHDPAKIKTLCNADCSSSTMAIIRAVGLDKSIPVLASANISSVTGTMINGELERLGFTKYYYAGESMLKTGDVLMTDGHACIVIAGNPDAEDPEPEEDPEPLEPEQEDTDPDEQDFIVPEPDIPYDGPMPADDAGDIVVLKYGDGLNNPRNDVKAMQLLLRCHGYTLDADGEFGHITELSLKRFQAAQGLKYVNGICGEESWKQLIRK